MVTDISATGRKSIRVAEISNIGASRFQGTGL